MKDAAPLTIALALFFGVMLVLVITCAGFSLAREWRRLREDQKAPLDLAPFQLMVPFTDGPAWDAQFPWGALSPAEQDPSVND